MPNYPGSRSNAPLSGAGRAVLYLDYDGVLHCDDVYYHPSRGVYLKAPPGYELWQHVPLLEEALAPYPELLIVLSTSWVVTFGYSQARAHLPESLRSRVVGATYHCAMQASALNAVPRGWQILQDVQQRKPRDWLALDNDVRDWPEAHLGRLVHTDDQEGLAGNGVLRDLKRRLRRLHT